MQISAQHATHVVHSVRNLARNSGNRRLAVDINQTIEESLSILSSVLRKVDLKLSAQIPLRKIEGSNGEFVQVWINLIKNALEAMAKHNTDLAPELIIKSKQVGKRIVVQIADNGPGIPKKDQEKVFQPNFTTKGKRKRLWAWSGAFNC